MNYKFIILSAFSPRDVEIASLRIEKLGKYISKKFPTVIISGKPMKEKKNYDIGNSKLIEVNYKSFSKNISGEKNLENQKKLNKYNLYGHLEYFFPIAPGGKRLYNIKELEKILIKEIEQFNGKIFLIASYGPFFILKLAVKLKQKYKSKVFLIEDFRDMIGKFNPHHSTNIFIENAIPKIIKNADILLTVSQYMGKRFIENYNLIPDKLYVLYNGFDGEYSFKSFNKNITKKDKLKIVYTGSLYEQSNRSIIPFIEGLKKINNKKNIEFIYCGKDYRLVDELFKKNGLENILKNKELVDREQALEIQSNADLLLLITYTGNRKDEGIDIISGKFFEYLISEKPILNIGNIKWELKNELESDGVSKVIEATDVNEIRNYIETFEYLKNNMNIEKRRKIAENFDFKYLVDNLFKKLKL
ncbi:hypothetical protein [Marinitoga litoralis]|uniref:hypothetical protein n=1 Tax=Marinitoga litoralis TaxID=570855 RepID=UPI00195FF10C|nr:hypothetical protein [Marinitoga litoralis]MBM7560335.1 glycosyltransferase involved in cell wall biosynthesis [Marinitoga litoralis]